MYRRIKNKYHYLCVHPGGPYFKNKDKNCWSIPKGVVENKSAQEARSFPLTPIIIYLKKCNGVKRPFDSFVGIEKRICYIMILGKTEIKASAISQFVESPRITVR